MEGLDKNTSKSKLSENRCTSVSQRGHRTSRSSLSSCRAFREHDSAPSSGPLSHFTRLSPGCSGLEPPSRPTPGRRPRPALNRGPAGWKTTWQSSARSPETLHTASSSSRTYRETQERAAASCTFPCISHCVWWIFVFTFLCRSKTDTGFDQM